MTRNRPCSGECQRPPAAGPEGVCRRGLVSVSRWWLGSAAALLTGCSTIGFYAQAIEGQLDLLARRQDVGRLVADPSTDPRLRERLQLARQIRNYAVVELALPDNGSYRSYVELERSAMLWSLFATPEFSVAAKTWCYPVIGCASYRGYFSLDAAQRAAATLSGMDVAVEPVAAYSTLGWFDDPLPSTVLRWPAARLAGLIFHELAHQQLYVAGDSAFNEAFALAVEREGVGRWLAAEGNLESLEAWRRDQARQQQFTDLLLATRARLQRLYQLPLPEPEMRQAKSRLFVALKRHYQALRQSWRGGMEYDRWIGRVLNNAHLASVATYERWVPAFQALLDANGGDLTAFYRSCRQLAELSPEARLGRLKQLARATPS